MESEKTQIKNADNSEKFVDNTASTEQHQSTQKSRKLRPFAVMAT